MSFMVQIDAARPPPLDQLILDGTRRGSLEFCQRLAAVPEEDRVVAKRLDVPVAEVRGWRDVGKRVLSCR